MSGEHALTVLELFRNSGTDAIRIVLKERLFTQKESRTMGRLDDPLATRVNVNEHDIRTDTTLETMFYSFCALSGAVAIAQVGVLERHEK